MTSRFCRWKPCSEVQSFGGKFCTRHTCGGGLDGDCTNKIAFEGAERCIHHKCSVVDCTATKLDYADVNYCLAHYQGGSGGPSSSFPNLSTQETAIKDEPTADSEETEELAAIDTASTALIKYSGKDHFTDSNCRDAYCREPATGESPYCRLHKCWRAGCNAQRVFEARVQKWSQGCGTHTCRYKGCLGMREKGSDYCAGRELSHLPRCLFYLRKPQPNRHPTLQSLQLPTQSPHQRPMVQFPPSLQNLRMCQQKDELLRLLLVTRMHTQPGLHSGKGDMHPAYKSTRYPDSGVLCSSSLSSSASAASCL